MTTQARLIAQKQAEALEAALENDCFPGSNLIGIKARLKFRASNLRIRAQAEAAQPEGEKGDDVLRDKIQGALMTYRCIGLAEEGGDVGYPLVDALTPGQADSIRPGIDECLSLADHIADYLQPMFRAARSHQAQAVEGLEERERMRLAGISTAALGYWKVGDSIHPDYVTTALYDVADLYQKYVAAKNAAPPTQQEALAPVGHSQLTLDLAMLCRRLMRKLRQSYTEDINCDISKFIAVCEDLYGKAGEFLRKHGLQGSPLREEYTEGATPSPQAVPEGFVLVPRESNSRMMNAGASMLQELQSKLATTRSLQQIVALIWTTMHENAPKDQP